METLSSGLVYVELLVVALAPVLFLITYIYLRDKYEPEPLYYLVITFLLGVACAYPAIWLGEFLTDLTGASPERTDLVKLAIYAFVVVAIPEELMKYLVLRLYNYPHKEFDEPYDGIMYGATVALGFAALENILYVFNAHNPWDIGLTRMFTAVPAHATFGVIMGYFVGKAKFLHGEGKPWLIRLWGLLAAVFLHGLYDYFIFMASPLFMWFSLLSLLIGLFLARRAMDLHAEESPHRHD